MQPLPSLDELRLERPDLSDEQLLRREQRLRLVSQLNMLGLWPSDALDPPDHPDSPWRDEARLQTLLCLDQCQEKPSNSVDQA